MLQPKLIFIFFLYLVSDEILQKSINSMQGNLKKLEKELETYKPLNDPEDKFLTVMKISFLTFIDFLWTVLVHHIMTLSETEKYSLVAPIWMVAAQDFSHRLKR